MTYRIKGKQKLYHEALIMVRKMRTLDMARLVWELRGVTDLGYEDVREVAAKAIRVERGRQKFGK
jgi:hypothetical protein